MEHDANDFELGDALVRPRTRTIEIGGESRQIDHKALHVLMCLARRPGAVVAKAEIFDSVWPQAFVSDDVLTSAISRLRRAFGDNTKSPRFIETVPSVGYRLIAPVNLAEPPLSEPFPSREVAARSRWRWRLAAALLASVALLSVLLTRRPADTPATPRSLAVLPLENLTGDPGQAHIAAGMNEALITGLARHQGLRVVSRASVQRYESSRPPLDEIARQLGVDILVEGSVQRSGNQLRVSTRLIDVDSDRHLWAESFDGEVGHFLDLQEQVVAAITRELGSRSAIESPAWPTMPVTPAAYESYLRARYLLGQLPSRRRLAEAVEELERAIAVEDDFAAAHMALAEAFLILGDEGFMPPRPAFARVRDAAQRALSLRKNEARPQALLAMVLFLHDWDFTAAQQGFERALALDTHDILARDGYSRLLTVTGRFEEALDQQRILREINPLIYHQPYLAYIYNMARQHDLALGELKRQLTLEQRSARLYSHLASTHRWLGRPAEAIAPFTEHLRLKGASPADMEQFRAAFDSGDLTEVGRVIVRHYDELAENGSPVPAMTRAEAFVLASEHDAAIDQIETAFAQREPGLLVIVHNPDYDVLRERPEFQAVLRRLGLPETVHVARATLGRLGAANGR